MSIDILNRYLALWQDPSPHRDLAQIDELTIPEVHFKDPINDVIGRDNLKRIFHDATAAVSHTTVEIQAVAWVDPRRAFVKWRYAGNLRRLGNRPWSVIGMSDIAFSPDGYVARHEDHWDLASGLYEEFPLIGRLFRHLRRRLRLRT